jgi:predicted ATPase/DNA-binding CsgD family transcriptional regulator
MISDDEALSLMEGGSGFSAPHRATRRLGRVSVARNHNLPAPHTHLIGREQDSATVRALVLQAPGRLVTLTGTGGCGKTQLALLVAAGLVDTFSDGVWLVELATVQAPHLVPYAIASVLGRRERAREDLIDTLVAHLETRAVLLVLDNCEHLIDACAALTERLLVGCPRLRLLATSRERLRIGAETNWRVPSLPGPDPRATVAPDDLLAYPAVELFVERAHAVQPDFALSQATVSSVAGICARLEGLPLALELAAARVSALSLAQILERLDDSFQLLVGGSRTAPTRQQTLLATLDWSHGLLSAAEQAIFRRLAVFSGGWSLEAAEAVCTDDAKIPRVTVIELLTQLVDKSLVVVAEDERTRRSRYRLLEPIRQYARDQLEASGELDLVARRHAAYFLAFAEPLGREAGVGGALRDESADAIMAEYRNLLVALRRALDTQDADLALRLAWTLEFVWKWRLPVGEGRPWVEEVLALPGAATPTPGRAVSLLTAAHLAWGRGDYAAADRYYAEADPLARALNDPWILYVVQVDQGNAAQQRGDYAAARQFFQEGLRTTRASGLPGEAVFLMNLGRLHIFEGNYAVGRAQCEEALAFARKVGDVWVVWHALNALALAALAQDDLGTARALSYEGLKLKPDPSWQIRELFLLGQIAIAEGDYTSAHGHLIHALALLENTDDPVAIALIVETVGKLASHVGRADVALRLAAAAEAARDVGDVAISRSLVSLAHFAFTRALRDRWLIPLKQNVDPENASGWWAEGYALSLADAVALAESLPLTAVSSPDPSSVRGASSSVTLGQPDMAGLTAREAEVLRLVAKGQSNKEIAAELVLSVRTVERHITNIYGKIDARGKADATAYAIHHGIV